MHCKGTAWTRLFDMGLISVKGLVCSLAEIVIVALGIGEFHSQGKRLWCIYDKRTYDNI